MLDNRFVFHRTRVIDMQSIVELLQLILDFLTSGNKVRLPAYIFHVVFRNNVDTTFETTQKMCCSGRAIWLAQYAFFLQFRIVEQIQPWSLKALKESSQMRLYIQ